MAKLRLIIDTDIVIDALNGIKPARDLFKATEDIDIYCSILTRKKLTYAKSLMFVIANEVKQSRH